MPWLGEWPAKDPDDLLVDYSLDLSDPSHIPAGHAIQSFNWTAAPGGLSLTGQQRTGLVFSVKVSGGTAGVDYTLTLEVLTDLGLELNRSARLPVRER